MTEPIIIKSLGDTALIIYFGDEISAELNARVHTVAHHLSMPPLPGLIEMVPAYTTLTIHYDPLVIEASQPEQTLRQIILSRLEQCPKARSKQGRTIDIPVCYDAEFGPDLSIVANHNQITTDEVICCHSSGVYQVYFLGFSPGFPFMGGMSVDIATPRRDSPRFVIPAGSVGIAGAQTGIYPMETPGGWQLIGRTPIPLVDFDRDHPTLLQPGDNIKFQPISSSEYQAIYASKKVSV